MKLYGAEAVLDVDIYIQMSKGIIGTDVRKSGI